MTATTDQRLRSLVDRAVKLHEERAALSGDIKDIMQEAKSAGYDVPGLQLTIKRVLENSDKRKKREDAETISESMLAALGEFGNTALGQFAIQGAAGASGEKHLRAVS